MGRDSAWIPAFAGMTTVLLVCLCLQLPTRSEATPGEYSWPLGREAPIAGTFGEYREGHFHTGIDFSTGGKTGLSVYAVADGEVCRVADSLTGFGKTIYLKHRDGNMSVYAHLENFSGDIAKRVFRLRANLTFRDKLDTSIAPGSLQVRKGQQIGVSGESGAGLPHLHFELRRDEERLIHPFDFLPRPSDRTAPVFLYAGFMPVVTNEEDAPFQSPGRYYYGLGFRFLNGRYTSENEFGDPTLLSGKFWTVVAITDTSDYSGAYRLSPRRIRYSVDHQDTRAILFDCLTYTAQENKKVGLIYDLHSSSSRGAYLFRLFTGLPRPECPLADGVECLDASGMAEGAHRIWVEVEDINGNLSSAEIPFVAGRISENSKWDETLKKLKDDRQTFFPKKRKPKTLMSLDGRVTCSLSPKMLYSDEAVTILDYYADGPERFAPPPPESTLPLGMAYSFAPSGTPLASPATLRFKAPRSDSVALEKMGIYRLGRFDTQVMGKWIFVGSIPDTKKHALSVKIDRLGDYTLFDDSVPPRILPPRDKPYSREEEIHIPVTDLGSGIADTGQVIVDGKPHEEWYYDADRGWIRLILKKVKRGAHRVEVTMADRLGNVRRETWPFRVR